jgi:hypothetical protein
MLGVQLLMVMLCGQIPEEQADMGDLVSQLGAGRYAQREAASRTLEDLGRPALPALRAARGARDPEIRTRASGLVQKIEGSLLTQATRVRLDFERAPLADVVRSLGQQAGFQVTLYPENQPRWRSQRVTLQRPDPVPFWKAVDLLCDAAVLEPTPGLHGIAGPREPTFALGDGTSRPAAPHFDHGPFRVSLQGVHYQSDLNYGVPGLVVPGVPGQPARPPRPFRPPIQPVTSEQFTAQLVVAAEPRLFLSQTGAPQVTEAVDNRGNSLTVPDGGRGVNRFSNYLAMNNASVLQLQAPLHRPSAPGKTIKKLRGVIPLAIASRGPDPLVVPLDAASLGKRFANADVEVTVLAIRSSSEARLTQIDLSVKANERPGSADSGDPDAFGDIYRPDLHRQQMEIVDTRGRLVIWNLSTIDSEAGRLTLTLPTAPAADSLKELRYYTLTRATIDLPFEFADIPMP